MSLDKLRILPLGGLGEVGMNCLVLEWKDDIVLLDCGVQFPDGRYSGVDFLIPDLRYVRDRLEKLRGIVITHGHDDHIGALPYLAQERELDIYCTAFPKGLIQSKLIEFPNARQVRFHAIRPREIFRIGPFYFDPIAVQHSIIEAQGFGIETPVGNLVHTGDFKLDASQKGGQRFSFTPFREWGDKGVQVLFSDSTNAEHCGHTFSESEVAKSFVDILSVQKGRILVALFASNIRRIENILGIAHKQYKHVALEGRSMHSYLRLAHEQGSIRIPDNTIVLMEDIHRYPDDKVIILLTGSQAETKSALHRISAGTHKNLQIKNGDCVLLSSRIIPGNERAITGMINSLCRQGAEVIYEDIRNIHVSGHGFQDELIKMLKAVRPKYFVPVHGEFRHLTKHARLAKLANVSEGNIKVIENGQVLEVSKDKITLGERLEVIKEVVVNNSFMQSDPAIFAERASLMRTGIVFVAVLQDHTNFRLVGIPRVNAHGVVLRRELDAATTIKAAEEYLHRMLRDMGRDGNIEDIIRLHVRRFFGKRASHKPAVVVSVIEV